MSKQSESYYICLEVFPADGRELETPVCYVPPDMGEDDRWVFSGVHPCVYIVKDEVIARQLVDLLDTQWFPFRYAAGWYVQKKSELNTTDATLIQEEIEQVKQWLAKRAERWQADKYLPDTPTCRPDAIEMQQVAGWCRWTADQIAWTECCRQWEENMRLGDKWRMTESTPQPANVGDQRGADAPGNEPTADAFKAYRACRTAGLKQGDVAKKLKTNQGQISRWVDQVSKWIAAGNILPDLPTMTHKPMTMDPAKIDMGQRVDRHNQRQRQRRTADTYDGE